MPLAGLVRIQRIRCAHCLRTVHVLPSFLLRYKSYHVCALKKLILTFINHPDDWKKSPDIEMDMATAYRWRRYFRDQVLTSLPAMRAELVKINPLHRVRGPSDGQPGIAIDILFKRYLVVAEQLAKAAVRLAEGENYKSPDLFCFLNHFLWQKDRKGLLMR